MKVICRVGNKKFVIGWYDTLNAQAAIEYAKSDLESLLELEAVDDNKEEDSVPLAQFQSHYANNNKA